MTQTPPRTLPVPPEHLLLRFGLLSLDQLNVALREQNATGTPFTDILVRDGIVSATDLARVLGETQAPEPEPAAEPQPDPEVEPTPTPPTVSYAPPPPAASLPAPLPAEVEPAAVPQAPPVFVVRGHLVNGEDVEIAAVADAAEAQRIALDAMRACARTDGSDWPVLNGRYVRPASIVSIDVSERV